MEILDIKISRRSEILSGIALSEGQIWLFIKNNPVDYMLDGYSYVNKKYIKKIYIPYQHSDFEHEIFRLKFCNDIQEHNDLHEKNKLNSYLKLMSSFLEQQKIIEVELESDNYCLIGKINKVNEKSFVLNMIGTKGENLGEVNIKLHSVRMINTETDYLNSLKLYFDKYGFSDGR